MIEELAKTLLTLSLGAAAALIAWFAFNWIGIPALHARDRRLHALDAVGSNAYVGSDAPEERIFQARKALREAASELRAIGRAHAWPVKAFSDVYGCNFEIAANALMASASLSGGDKSYDDDRSMLADIVYYCLGAGSHLTPDRTREIEQKILEEGDE